MAAVYLLEFVGVVLLLSRYTVAICIDPDLT